MRNPLRRLGWLERNSFFYFLLAGCAYACLSFGELYRYVLEPTIFYTKFAEFFPEYFSYLQSFYALYFPEERERYVVMIASIKAMGPFLGVLVFLVFYPWMKKEIMFRSTLYLFRKYGKFEPASFVKLLLITLIAVIACSFYITEKPSMSHLSRLSWRAGFSAFVVHFYFSVALIAYFFVASRILISYILYPSKTNYKDYMTEEFFIKLEQYKNKPTFWNSK